MMQKKHRLLAVVLSLAMVFGLAPANAWAADDEPLANAGETHSHDMSVECGNSDPVDFKPLDVSDLTDNELAAGNYYLTEDITLDSILTTPGSTPDGVTLNLCLNGHKLEYNGSADYAPVIQLNSGVTLNLCDCSGSGSPHTITSPATNEQVTINGGLLPATALAAGDGDGLYIGGVALPDGYYYINGGTVSGTEPSDWNAKYEDNTLTIRDLLVEGLASSDTQESAGIYYNDYDGSTPLTLVIEGANSVTGGDNSSASGAYASHGIYSGDALTIEGEGALSVSGGTVAYAADSMGISTNGALTIESGTINATGGTASGTGSSYGIRVDNGDLEVSGGVVNTTGGTASTDGDAINAHYSAGIYVTRDSAYFNGGTVVATGGTATFSRGIWIYQSDKAVNATGGILVARAGGGTNTSKAIEGKLTMTGAKIAGGTAESAAVAIVPDGYTVQNDALINEDNAPDYTIDTDTAVVVTQGTPLALMTAGSSSSVTLNGDLVLINLQNKTQTPALHLGTDAEVSGTGTLTAIGAPGQTSSFGVSGTGQDFSVCGVTVIAIGSTASNSYGIGAQVYVDVSENGSVIAIGGAAGNTDGCKSRGISGAVAADSGTINAIGGTAAASCGAFSDPAYSNSTVTVTSGTLNAVGGVSDDPSCGVSAPSVTVADAGMIHAVGRAYGLSAKGDALAGGSFTGGTAAIQHQNAGSVSDLLAEGCGFYAGDSQLTPDGDTVGGPCQTVTVKPAAPAVIEAQWGASADALSEEGSLAQAFAANPAYIRLQTDVTLDTGVTVADGATTLDLNGSTITGAVGVTPITLSGGALTITDTAATKGGVTGGDGEEVTSGAGSEGLPAVSVSGGTLTVDAAVTFTGGNGSDGVNSSGMSAGGHGGDGISVSEGGILNATGAFAAKGSAGGDSTSDNGGTGGNGIKLSSGGMLQVDAGIILTGGTGGTGVFSKRADRGDGLYIYGGKVVSDTPFTAEGYRGVLVEMLAEGSTLNANATGDDCGFYLYGDSDTPSGFLTGGTYIGGDDGAAIQLSASSYDLDHVGLLAEGRFYTDGETDVPITDNDILEEAKKLVVETAAPAAPHSHAVSVDCSTTEGDQVEFTPWDGSNMSGDNGQYDVYLKPGNYYLTNDITISKPLKIESGTVNLCLNGCTLKSSSSVQVYGTLNICDCSEHGSINHTGASTAVKASVPNSVVNLYGGTVEGQYAQYGLSADAGNAKIAVYGGTVKAERSALRMNGEGSVLALSGAPVLEGREADIDLDHAPLHIAAPLAKPDEAYTVKPASYTSPASFTSGWSTHMPQETDLAAYFVPVDANYSVALDDSGELKFAAAASDTYTVTVTSGGNGTASASHTSAAEGTTITLTANPSTGYHFEKWEVTSGNVTITNNKFTMPAGNVTITAHFEKDSGGSSSGGGGGGGGSSTTTTTEKNPDGSTTTTKTDKNTGTVTETTKYPDGSSTTVETKKDGTVTTTEKTADGSTYETVENADGSSQTTVEQADGTKASSSTDTEGKTEAEVSLSDDAVNAAQESGETIPLPIPPVNASKDSGDAPVVDVAIPGSSSGEVKVEIPVENTTPGTVAVIVNEDGTETVVKKSVADEDGVSLTLDNSATVKIVDNAKDFIDVPETSWASEAVDYVSAREIFNGTSANTFSPNGAMTRGMLAKVLHNLEDGPLVDYAMGFEDVNPDAYYGEAVRWAASKGIVDGYSSGVFGPNDSITREQLAVMLWRYAGTPSSSQSLNHFTDAGEVSGYAREAMEWAVETGIISGTTSTTISPKDTATRAQVAAMLMRFAEAQQ